MVRITMAAPCFLNTDWTGLFRGSAVHLFWRCPFWIWSQKPAVLSEVARYGVLMAVWLMVPFFRYKTRHSWTTGSMTQHYAPEDLHHNWGFLWFFSVPPNQFCYITSIRQLSLLSKVCCFSNLWSTNHPPIDSLESEILTYKKHMKWPTEKDWKFSVNLLRDYVEVKPYEMWTRV